ncbi:MAG: rod-binding protein [Alphaproteobacteria bacterium]
MDALSITGQIVDQARGALADAARPGLAVRGGETAARKVAEDFEAFFIAQFVDQMMAGTEIDPPWGGGPGESVFRSLMGQEYGRMLARQGGLGIADTVMAEILRMQEAQQT